MPKVTHLRSRKLPTTVEEAVDRLIRWLSDAQLDDIASRRYLWASEGKIVSMRLLGMAIRNEFGLWGDNAPLLAATGKKHADPASCVIMRALWQRLRRERKDGRCKT